MHVSRENAANFQFFYPCMAQKVLFFWSDFENEFLMELHILRSLECKSRIFIDWFMYECVKERNRERQSIVNTTQYQMISENTNFILYIHIIHIFIY